MLVAAITGAALLTILGVVLFGACYLFLHVLPGFSPTSVEFGELKTFREHGQMPSSRALRELLALQSSDWAFLASRDWADDYPRQRASGHAAQLARALKGETEEPHVRNLAPYLERSYS